MNHAMKTPHKAPGIKRTSMNIPRALHVATKQLAANTDQDMNVTYLEGIELILQEIGIPHECALADEKAAGDGQKTTSIEKDSKHISPAMPGALCQKLKSMAAWRGCTINYLFTLGLCRILRQEAEKGRILMSRELQKEIFRHLAL